MKRLFLFAAAAAMLAGCSESEELAVSQAQQEMGQGEVAFSVYTNRITRAGKSGVLNTDSLKKPDGGFGIFAYHTNNSFYDSENSEINFMYNQRVTWNETNNRWTYSPLKYWPNEFGENAKSNSIDYVTFFAYAPYVEFYPTTGVAKVGENATSDEKQQIQWKNITAASRNGDIGDPVIRYMVDTNPKTSVDLLWGVAADETFRGLADEVATKPTELKENGAFLNLSKQVGVNDSINWRFHHALAKLDVQIIAANDVVTEEVDPYTPEGKALPDSTRVYLRWIEFTGFAMNGALNLNSGTPADGVAPKPRWMAYDGATELKPATVRFNDGLMDGQEGTENNVNPNERVLGALNPVLVEPTTPAEGWTAKKGGIPTDKYVNVFDGGDVVGADGKLQNSFYVIPTGENMTISMLYDIQTADKRLGKYLSDGKTPGFRVANEIHKPLQDALENGIKIEAGKAYNIKIVVGLESVKVTATVKGWENSEQDAVVNMPENP